MSAPVLNVMNAPAGNPAACTGKLGTPGMMRTHGAGDTTVAALAAGARPSAAPSARPGASALRKAFKVGPPKWFG